VGADGSREQGAGSGKNKGKVSRGVCWGTIKVTSEKNFYFGRYGKWGINGDFAGGLRRWGGGVSHKKKTKKKIKDKGETRCGQGRVSWSVPIQKGKNHHSKGGGSGTNL